ncbi:MAG: dTMP kinase [Clostridiales bacterium]|nr:dTMP kinase [Clostridiales bacterium]
MTESNTDPNRGSFIVFEGIDGSGKSTQIRHLMDRLKTLDLKCYETKEPTDGPIGSLIRQFLTGRIKTDDRVMASLFAADRLDHLLNANDGIAGKIGSGINVISDRYYLSSYAYHSVSLPIEWVIEANAVSAGILRPTCTIFIDIDPETALARIKKNRSHTELYEVLDRLVATRQNYLEAIELIKDEENIIIVDGALDETVLADLVWEKISPFLLIDRK